MCMIAYHPAGAGTLTSAVVDTAMNRHADGFGFMWRDTSGDKPVVRVQAFEPSKRAEFRAALAPVIASGAEYAVHFRMATSGPRNADMSHPFVYTDPNGEQVAVMHNGVIGIQHDRAVESDTSAFVRLVLAELPANWWDSPALVYLVREAIGTRYSKLTIMTAERTIIVGEELGDWDEGLWYSSEHRPTSYSWRASTPVVKATGTKADPKSKRSQKRAAAAARKGKGLVTTPPKQVVRNVTSIVPYTTPEDAYVEDDGFRGTSLAGFTHLGHSVTSYVDLPLDRDGDYVSSVMCDECQTIGDVYIIDGQRYVDLSHDLFGERVQVDSALIGLTPVAVA